MLSHFALDFLMTPSPPYKPPSENAPHQLHIRKPSQQVQDIIHKVGVTSNRRSDPRFDPGIQAPTIRYRRSR